MSTNKSVKPEPVPKKHQPYRVGALLPFGGAYHPENTKPTQEKCK